MRKLYFAALAMSLSMGAAAQRVQVVKSTEGNVWQKETLKLSQKAAATPIVSVKSGDEGTPFKAWGMTFNELDWDALCMLTRAEQD